MVSKKELARHFGVSERTITNWMRTRRVSYFKLGKTVRFDLARVSAELEKSSLIPSVVFR
jgi:excisionase family DNA binding protein